jgi:UDP-N-acetylglucosamine transferase subunit ALG13
MIFATVGTQLPFDRLLAGLDVWAARNPGVPVTAQAGLTSRAYVHLHQVAAMPQPEFRRHVQAARLVVAHAGMGTILSAAELGKPLIIMPRLAKFGEHRNDHQVDTAREMSRLSHVIVADDGEKLHAALDLALAHDFAMPPAISMGNDVCAPLLDALRDFVWASHTAPEQTKQQALRATA